MAKSNLSKATSTFGLVAIVVAPLATFLLPIGTTGKLVAANIQLKDAILLTCVAVLGVAIFARRAFESVALLVARRPFYRTMRFNYFYLADGSVLIRNNFDYINGWRRSQDLPREDLIWHQEITENDLLYRLYERGKLRDRRMASAPPTIISAVPMREGGELADHRYSWIPQVKPELGRKEHVSFVVEIFAAKTETAAFAAGTKMGFGVNVRTKKASLKAHAPFGYRFVLIDPTLTVRRTSDLTEVNVGDKMRPTPQVSPDGSLLTLDVSRPSVGRRYWVHYRFEPIRP